MCASIAAGCGFSGPSLQAGDGGSDAALPPAEVNFASASSTQDEMSGAFQVEVSLSRASATPITVNYALVDHSGDGWATAGTDFTGGDGTITFAPGEMIKGIDLTIIQDNEDEPDESFELALTSATGDAALGGATSHTVTISAFTLPRVYFSTATGNGMESATSVQLALTLNTPASSDVTVGYAVSGTASLMTGMYPDHNLTATGTVTIPANTTSLSIPVTITNDTTDEDAEHLIVTLSSSTNAVVDQTKKQYDYTIDDDDAPPDLTFEQASVDLVQDEAAVDVTLHATLSARSEKAIAVPFMQNTAGVTNGATATADFTYMTTGPLTWTAGTTMLTKDIVIRLVDDVLDEEDEHLETVFGTPTVPANVNIPAGTKSTVTIRNSDTPSVIRFDPLTPNVADPIPDDADHDLTFDIVLDKPSGKTITVDADFTNDSQEAEYGGDDGTGGDYNTNNQVPLSFAPGDTKKTLTIKIVGDTTMDPGNTLHATVTLKTPTNATLDPDTGDITRTFSIDDTE